ncbi:hypothetical protein FOQG_19557 [Fusarium oxysporum f. sp. raphani 54005]|uniref:Uncharacterized protein n=1 Tax=Fusarium oxysporum f. sp. raphani 54005 TaxID=1089458 RepID=X0BYS9_FUSOX|nr:hypothetical protein FOQG_19557 [Fusarium oxysporum f. sp. raphani 54005]
MAPKTSDSGLHHLMRLRTGFTDPELSVPGKFRVQPQKDSRDLD